MGRKTEDQGLVLEGEATGGNRIEVFQDAERAAVAFFGHGYVTVQIYDVRASGHRYQTLDGPTVQTVGWEFTARFVAVERKERPGAS